MSASRMQPPIPPHIAQIVPYRPGKPIEEVEREFGVRDSVKLASNENALGPSPLAVEAVREALESVHRYPQGDGFYLRRAIGERTGLPDDQVILGNGSTELIEIAAKTFLGADGSAVFGEQAFLMYRIAVQSVNGNGRAVPFRGRTHDLAAMARAVDGRTRLVYVANPNNPTGTYVGAEEVRSLLDQVPDDVVVVLDEAYREYIDEPDFPDSIAELRRGRKNLLVLRTFSKAHGLAGLRIGYGLGSPSLLDPLHRVRSPFNTSSVAQAGALAALDDTEHIDRSRRVNRVERVFLEGELRARGMDVTPSVANFLLVDVGRDAEGFFADLLPKGVVVRPMGGYGFPTSIRLTVGTRGQNERFLQAVDALALGSR